MKLESFKFQDGKVFWLPKYPERPIKCVWGKMPPERCIIKLCECAKEETIYNIAVAQSLASAIEVALEDQEQIRILLCESKDNPQRSGPNTYQWQPENGKVYSAECEIEIYWQNRRGGKWANCGEQVYKNYKTTPNLRRQVARLKYTAANDPSKTTEQERLVLMGLQEAHNIFIRLPVQHNDDVRDWADTIHRAQQIVMSRIAVRCNPEMFTNISK